MFIIGIIVSTELKYLWALMPIIVQEICRSVYEGL